MKHIAYFIYIVLIFFLYGCQSNIRLYHKGNVVARGLIKSEHEAYFFNIEIGSPENPISEQNRFIIEFGDGRRILLPDIGKKDILLGSNDIEDKDITYNWKGKLCEAYHIECVAFIFHQEKLISVRIVSNTFPGKDFSPKIGKTGMNNFYIMPLNQKQLFEVFGPPDELIDIIIL